MSKKEWFAFDAAGWVFYVVVAVLLLGPSIWLSTTFIDPKASRWYFIVAGLVIAAVASGCFSSAVNYVLQRRQKKQRIARRKQAKKQR